MSKGKRQLACLLVAMICCFCSAACTMNKTDTTEKFVTGSHATEKTDFCSLGTVNGMDVAFRNNELSLLVNTKTTEVAVYNHEDDSMWRLIPGQEVTTGILSDDLREQVQSLFSLLYYTNLGQNKTYCSYTDSVKDEQFSLYTIPGGIRFEFTVGAADKEASFPKVLTKKKMESLISGMAEEDRNKIERFYQLLSYADMSESLRKEYLALYPNLVENDLYIAKANIIPRFKDQIIKAFRQAGLTLEDIRKEYEKVGYSEEVKEVPSFQIPLEITLEDSTLVTRIPCSEIVYNKESYKLTEITLTPYFCAGTTKENGYLLVPDGSGVLIDLNNQGGTSFTTTCYGTDQTLASQEENYSYSQNCVVPAYGIKSDDKGFVTVIDDGAALASLLTSPVDSGTGLSSCSPTFTILTRDESRSNGLVKEATIVRYANESYMGDLTLRTFFLKGENADYSGMAAAVRHHFLADVKTAVDSGLLLETYGAIERTEQLVGISYTKEIAYTDFTQAGKMLEYLADHGITGYDLRYLNWTGDGRNNTLSVSTKSAGALGSDYTMFSETMDRYGVTMFPDYSFLYISNDRLFDGFNKSSDACRLLSGSYAKESLRSIISVVEKDDFQRYMLTSKALERFLEKLSANAQKSGWKGLSLSDIGSDLYSDCNESNYSNRSQMQEAFSAIVKETSEKIPLLIEGGNLYMAPYASRLVGVPDTGSGYQIASRDVPFVQMVLSGHVCYYGSSLNMTENPQESFLRAIEYGSGLRYTLGARDSRLLTNTRYRDLFNTQFESWKDTVVSQYTEYASVMDDLRDKQIIRHEQVYANTYKTTYENGTIIYVNYGDAVTVEGVAVPAGGYRRVDKE